MVFISSKKIKGKERYYLEKSIRLLDGNVKKFSVYLKDYNSKEKYKEISNYKKLLDNKVYNESIEFASKYYRKLNVFSEDLLKKLEEIKLDYKEIAKKLSHN